MCVVKVSLSDRRLRFRSLRLLGVAFAGDEHVACGVSTCCQVEADVAGSAARVLYQDSPAGVAAMFSACRRHSCKFAPVRHCGFILGTVSSAVQVVRSVASGRVADNVSGLLVCCGSTLLWSSVRRLSSLPALNLDRELEACITST